MLSDIFIIFDFIIGIFCLLTSLFLLINAINTKKKVFYPFFLYFLLVSISLFLILVYVTEPNIGDQLGHVLILLVILLTFIGDLALLVMTFFINKKITRNLIISETSITFFFLLLIFLFSSLDITSINGQIPNLFISDAALLFLTYFTPNFFSILNLIHVDNNYTVFREKFSRNLIIFFILGIFLTFGKILSFFTIMINNSPVNLTYMDVFAILFIFQIFIIVYTIPINKNKDFALHYHGN